MVFAGFTGAGAWTSPRLLQSSTAKPLCHYGAVRDLARLFAYVRPHGARIAVSVLLMAIVGACYGAFALLLQPLLDRFLNPLPGREAVELLKIPITGQPIMLDDVLPASAGNPFTVFCGVLLAVSVVKGLCDYSASCFVNHAGFAAVRDIRNEMYRVVLNQSPAFFQTKHTGELISSLVSDIERIQSACSHFLADLMRQAFTVVALLFVLLQRDTLLTLVCVIVLPIVLLPASRIGKRLRGISRGAQDHLAQLVKIMQETISGNRIVKAFAMEAFEIRRFRERADRLFIASMRMVRQQAMVSPIVEMLGAGMVLCLVIYIKNRVDGEEMTPGQAISFIVALVMLVQPVKRLIGIYNIFQQALGAVQRAFEYMDHPRDVRNASGAIVLSPFREAIEFQRVTFQYPGSEGVAALERIQLTVRAGQVIALVGPSGAGKTTLMSLLPRFFDPSDGSIRIDGQDLRDVTVESLRRQIAIVSQQTILFDDTIFSNIAYGQPDIDPERVYAAAKAAYASEFIEALPNGYATNLGERGLRVSGGQQQRIAIARALLKDAPILLLDEATSHLDSESENLVQQALSNLIKGRTVIVSAHRFSTIKSADAILVLDRGQIVDMGTHATLVGGSGLYSRLVELQSVGST